jgi:hypothetical protein
MNADNVTPFRPSQPPVARKRRQPRESAQIKAIEKRADEIRDMVFEAQSIIEVSRAAIGSEVPADNWSSRTALKIAIRLLDMAAGRLEPGAITLTGVFRGGTPVSEHPLP